MRQIQAAEGTGGISYTNGLVDFCSIKQRFFLKSIRSNRGCVADCLHFSTDGIWAISYTLLWICPSEYEAVNHSWYFRPDNRREPIDGDSQWSPVEEMFQRHPDACTRNHLYNHNESEP